MISQEKARIIVNTILDHLRYSDFAEKFGQNAIYELATFTEDMAEDIVKGADEKSIVVPDIALPKKGSKSEIKHVICHLKSGIHHYIVVNGRTGSLVSSRGKSVVVVNGISYYACIPGFGMDYPEVYTPQGLPFTVEHRDGM